tara:strand:+ start:520 stop:846 length:327 start_codon:yes stop_codon:yes gene_type:complete
MDLNITYAALLSLYACNASQLRHRSREFDRQNTSLVVHLAIRRNIKESVFSANLAPNPRLRTDNVKVLPQGHQSTVRLSFYTNPNLIKRLAVELRLQYSGKGSNPPSV